MAKCMVCSNDVDTREVSEGGSEHGCQIDATHWVCSGGCYDAVMYAEQQAQFEKEQFEQEQREHEAREMEDHFRLHPHG